MLNHTYTSVKNANLVDCGKKQHISSQPQHLVRDNFLGEYRTELDKKKVLANLGIATELSLEWENIKGDIGRSESLINELNSRTKYISIIDGFTKNVTDGIKYLESVVYTDLERENEQNNRLTSLEATSSALISSLKELQDYLQNTVTIDLNKLTNDLQLISDKVQNITELIQVSTKKDNALIFIQDDGLYVPDLSKTIEETSKNVGIIQEDLKTVQNALDDFVTKEDLGGDTFDFVNQSDFENYTQQNQNKFNQIEADLLNTVKTGQDGHVDTLFVNTISKETKGNISITDSFEVSTNIPLDIRAVVSNIDELHSLNPEVCYPGMGVVVADQASLYILREPVNGTIDEDYIKDANGINWKCPEDLVIEIITQEEYDRKTEEGSINPNMFYYIHEQVEEEPQRKDYPDDESYTEALNRWLRVLQQKYMSAVWGQEMESLVAGKASTSAVKSLEQKIQELSILIDSLQGGASEINLKDLNDKVQQHQESIQGLISDGGTIPVIQNSITQLGQSLETDYVTIDSITIDNPEQEYIFVKKTAFEDYITNHAEQLADKIVTNKITTDEINLGENTLIANNNSVLFNNEELALTKAVPVIEFIDKETFEKIEEPDQEKYYYIYEDDDRYILDSEFNQYKTLQASMLNTLSQNIGNLESLSTDNKNTLVLAINELLTKVSSLTEELQMLKEQFNNLQPDEQL